LTRELVKTISNGKEIKEPRRVPYILTSDSREENIKSTAIPLFKIIDWFEKLKSQRKVLILDMCHSGRFGKSQISEQQMEEIASAKGIHYAEIEDSKASIILTACPMGGISYEDKHLQNSVYTHFLLEGMRAGDLNRDGAVSISEAHNSAIDKTRQFTLSKKEYKQIPTAYSKILGKDPILVSGVMSNTGNSTLFSYTSSNQGVEIYLDKNYHGMLPKGIPVKPGEHKIECKMDGEIIYSETINFAPGFDYMFPYFDISAVKRSKFLYTLETSYQEFSRDDVPEKLIPGGPLFSVSMYHFNLKRKWFAMSYGIDFGQTKDLSQYAARLGFKYTKLYGKSRMFIGPDLKLSLFNYKPEIIEDKKIEDQMIFFSPGLEFVWVYPVKKTNLTLGARSYYMPYEINSDKSNIISYSGILSIGYSF